MNCRNCGAPLTPMEGRDYFRCTFCATCQFPEQLEDSADGITPLKQDQPCDQECPICAEPLEQGAVEGHTVLYCEKCRGVLVAKVDFPAIVTKRRAACCDAANPVPLKREELARQIDCPVCRQRMETHPYHGAGNAVIDTCPRCWLIWFDSGELAAIAQAAEHRPRQEETLFGRYVPRASEGMYSAQDLSWL